MSASEALGRQFQVEHMGRHPFGGEYVQAVAGDRAIGQMRYHVEKGWDDKNPDAAHTTVSHVITDPDQRKQGVAKAMYSAVHEKTGAPFLHATDEMSWHAKRAVRKIADQAPGQHQKLAWDDGRRTIKPY